MHSILVTPLSIVIHVVRLRIWRRGSRCTFARGSSTIMVAIRHWTQLAGSSKQAQIEGKLRNVPLVYRFKLTGLVGEL
jgi:hypothetical protein